MITGPKSFGWKLFWLILFVAAMAYLESAVVVYLRLIYYPEGFEFPLKIISGSTIWIEVGREAATLIMLTSVGILSASTGPGRFAAVCFIFGVWDIFYYIWLWIFIGWPQSLLTWDLLFLIPAPWIGPVITPVLVSICLIIAGIISFGVAIGHLQVMPVYKRTILCLEHPINNHSFRLVWSDLYRLILSAL